MASLAEKAAVAQDAGFIERVRAGVALLNLPFHPNQIMHVAAHADISGGAEGVTDDEILALLQPVSLPPGDAED